MKLKRTEKGVDDLEPTLDKSVPHKCTSPGNAPPNVHCSHTNYRDYVKPESLHQQQISQDWQVELADEEKPRVWCFEGEDPCETLLENSLFSDTLCSSFSPSPAGADIQWPSPFPTAVNKT